MARRRAASARRNAPSGDATRSTPNHTTAFGWRSAVVVVLLAFLAKFCIDGRRRYRAARDAAARERSDDTGGEECDFPLAWACEKNNLEIVELLLAHGADVTTTFQGNCAQKTYACLHFAARNNNPALVDLLLAHGAPVNQQTSRGVTPLFTACEQGHTEVARKLLDAGADPHMARDDGASVFNTGSACDIEEFAGPGKNHT